MESLVNKIIEIDRMEDGRINDAKKQSEDILKSAEEKCKKIREDITAAAEKRIAEIESINKSDYESKISVLNKKINLEKERMDSFFENHHTEIEKSIFSEIVGEQIEIR